MKRHDYRSDKSRVIIPGFFLIDSILSVQNKPRENNREEPRRTINRSSLIISIARLARPCLLARLAHTAKQRAREVSTQLNTTTERDVRPPQRRRQRLRYQYCSTGADAAVGMCAAPHASLLQRRPRRCVITQLI